MLNIHHKFIQEQIATGKEKPDPIAFAMSNPEAAKYLSSDNVALKQQAHRALMDHPVQVALQNERDPFLFHHSPADSIDKVRSREALHLLPKPSPFSPKPVSSGLDA